MYKSVRDFIRAEVAAGSAKLVRPSQGDKGYRPQHQRLLSVKEANRGSRGLGKIGSSSEGHPPKQLVDWEPTKERREELITPDLICPSTYQLLQNSSSDSGPNLSFDKPVSLELLFSLARVSLAEASKPNLSFRCSGGDYTSSCPLSLVSAKLAFCINKNCSCMKNWKSGFFFIDQWAILDAMVWRYPDATIDNPRPAAGSFNMADVRRLSAHVIKLRDMPEGVLVLSRLSRVWKSRFIIGIHDFLCLLKWTGAEVQEVPHLDRILSLIPLVPRFLLRPKLLRNERPLLLVPLQAMLLSVLGPPWLNLPVGRSSAAPAAKGSDIRDSQGKGIMVDDAAAPSGGASRPRPSSRPAPSFKNVSGDAIHTDFFPFYAGPYYATYSEGGVAWNCEFTCEELNQSHHEYVLSANSMLKGNEEKVASLTSLPLVAQTDYSFLNKISEHATKPLSVILQLELEKLVRPANVPIPRDTHVSLFIANESTVTPVSKSLDLSYNGISVALDDVTKLVKVGSRRVLSDPDDVVVALSAPEKGEGLDSSSAAIEKASINPSRV
uniref:Uncharacterized protein n=1 Tax=Tanacetum cinerariifolium TaxID=118510 RepID=A0A699GST5_TANCI|nr:hypothetical protein [Tanacetum cinerariifolium]